MLIKNIALLLFISIIASCASANINKEADIKVRLEKIRADDFSLKGKNLNHPFVIKEKAIADILNSIYFSERTGFFGWGEERHLFDSKEIERIAAPVKKGLEEARSDEIVVFEIEAPNGKTSGEVFVLDSLNLRFNSINGIPFSVEREATGMPPRGESSYSSDNYKVIPRIAHAYFSSKEIFGKEVKHLNWVIINTNKIETPAAIPQSPVSTPKTKEEATISERLQILKDLRDKGLISEDDYERKKKEILDSL